TSLGDLEVDDEAVPILHQRVAHVSELRLTSASLPPELRFRIRLGLVCVVAPLRATEVGEAVVVAAVVALGAETLGRGPRLDHGAVHGEVIRAQQSALARLLDHGTEKSCS